MSDNQDNYENETGSTGVIGGTAVIPFSGPSFESETSEENPFVGTPYVESGREIRAFGGPSFESGTSVENPFVGTPYVESGREIHAFGGPSFESEISIEPRDVTGPGSPDSLWPTARDVLEQQGTSNGNGQLPPPEGEGASNDTLPPAPEGEGASNDTLPPPEGDGAGNDTLPPPEGEGASNDTLPPPKGDGDGKEKLPSIPDDLSPGKVANLTPEQSYALGQEVNKSYKGSQENLGNLKQDLTNAKDPKDSAEILQRDWTTDSGAASTTELMSLCSHMNESINNMQTAAQTITDASVELKEDGPFGRGCNH